MALGACAALYVLAILAFAPAFLTEQVPMVLAAYEGYRLPWVKLLRSHTLLWAVLVLGLAGFRLLARDRRDPLVTGLLVAAAGFAIGYVVQRKGWPYHGLPVTFFLALAWLAGAIRTRTPVVRVAAVASLVLAGVSPAVRGWVYQSRVGHHFAAATAGAPKGSVIYVLSTEGQKTWPMLAEQGYVWPSRFMGLWMVPAIVGGIGDAATLAALSDRVRQMTADDLRCNPPALVLVDRWPLNLHLAGGHVDLLAYLAENRDARQLLNAYTRAAETPVYTLYRRVGPVPAPRPGSCRVVY